MNEAAGRRPPSLIAAAAAAAAAAALVAGCHVDAGYVYDHAHSCSSTSSAEQCGSTRAGEPMMCFAGYQLAGAGVGDFCTERCNPNASVDGAHVCLSSGAKLATCHPSGQGSNAACPYDELSCLRTDLLGDDGLCVKMPVCSVDGDCSDPSRSTCMATLVREFYGATNIPPVDHLYCLQSDCDRE